MFKAYNVMTGYFWDGDSFSSINIKEAKELKTINLENTNYRNVKFISGPVYIDPCPPFLAYTNYCKSIFPELLNDKDWDVYEVDLGDTTSKSFTVKGVSCPKFKSGPSKGEPNYSKRNKGSFLNISMTFEEFNTWVDSVTYDTDAGDAESESTIKTEDTGEETEDLAGSCLTGDTKIRLLSGKTISVKDLDEDLMSGAICNQIDDYFVIIKTKKRGRKYYSSKLGWTRDYCVASTFNSQLEAEIYRGLNFEGKRKIEVVRLTVVLHTL